MRSSRVLVLALLAGSFLGSAPARAVEDATPPDPAQFGLVGAYLAGRAAARTSDQALAAAFYMRALALDPGEAEIKARAMFAYAEDGLFDKAIPLARQIDGVEVSLPVADTFTQLLLAVDDLKAKRWDAADRRLAALPTRSTLTVIAAPLLRAWIAAGAGQDPAERLKPLADTAGVFSELHAALIAEVRGNRSAAAASYARLLAAQTPPSYRLVELAGAFEERGGHRQKAAELYRAFAATSGDPSLTAPGLARVDKGKAAPPLPSIQQGAAMALFDAATTLPRDRTANEIGLILDRLALWLDPAQGVAQLLTAETLEQLGREEAAIALWKQIDGNSPYSWSARNRAAAALNELGDTDAALNELKSLAAAWPDREEPLVRIGDILRQHERYGEALPWYDKAIARVGTLQKRHWNLLFSRAIAYERTDQWQKAEADLKRALQFEPEQPFLLNYLGYTWADKGMHLPEAEEMLRRAVAAAPRDGHIADSLGWVLFRQGRAAEAVAYLERASELAPAEGVIIDHLGDVYWMVGRQREAQFQWQRTLTLKIEDELKTAVTRKLKEGLPPAPPRP